MHWIELKNPIGFGEGHGRSKQEFQRSKKKAELFSNKCKTAFKQ